MIVSSWSLIAELSRRHSLVNKRIGGIVDSSGASVYFTKVWKCFNDYISEALRDGLSVHVNGFCTFGWLESMEATNPDSSIKSHAFFHLDDSFGQSLGLGAQIRLIQKPEFVLSRCHAKELNFASAAMRFGDGLTADQVRTGLRYIVQSVGESMRSKATTEIDFDVGRLIYSSSSASFKFNRNVVQSRKTLSRVSSAAPVKLLTQVDPVQSTLHTHLEPVTSRLEPQKPLEPVNSRPLSRQEVVYRQALNRHVSELNIRAASVAQARAAWESGLASASRVSVDRASARRSAEIANSHHLKIQMSEDRQRRQDSKDTSGAQSFPHFTGWTEKSNHEYQKVIQKTLDEQVAISRARKSIGKMTEKALVAEMKKENHDWVESERKKQLDKKKSFTRSLSASWDQDLCLHRMNHLIDHFDMAPPKSLIQPLVP